MVTDRGLVYVNYYVGHAVWGEWDRVIAARITKSSFLGATATVQVDFVQGPPWVLKVGKRAAQVLVDAVNDHQSR